MQWRPCISLLNRKVVGIKEQSFPSSTLDCSFLQKCPRLKPYSQPNFDCPNDAGSSSEWLYPFRNVSGPSPFVLENSIRPSFAACVLEHAEYFFPYWVCRYLLVIRRNVSIVTEILRNSFSFMVDILCLRTLSELILSYSFQLLLYSIGCYLWTLQFSRHFFVCACVVQSYIDGILQFPAFSKKHVTPLLQHIGAY
jgi:hypothetical protein